ncbi:MAG: L,D-transpeptidase [Xanthobacteraceae bacterium]
MTTQSPVLLVEVSRSGCCERAMCAANVGSIRATIVTAFAVCLLTAGTAEAQFLLWPQYRSWWGNHAPFRHKHPHRHRKPQLAKKTQAEDAPKGPLHIIISIADQRISVYDDGALIARSSVSTGVPRHPTPLGVFSVISKKRWHRSNLYSDAPMPYMQRITWSGIALHAGVLPGYPASHGCIRLKNDFAIRLWHLTKRRTRVIIAPDDTRPVEIANARLFVAPPKAASGPPESRAVIADNAIVAAAAMHAPSTPDADTQPVTSSQVPGSAAAAVAPRKVIPISILVSRKLSRLLVRRGSTPLFDSPVKIQNPEEPLGTHVFTVMGTQNEDAALRWTVVSIPEGSPRAPERPTTRRKSPAQHMETILPASSPDQANMALDRIQMPPDVVERIFELLTPGSSLIVSDYGISKETGNDTDFIVVTQ